MKISVILITKQSKNKKQSRVIHWLVVLSELRVSEMYFPRKALEIYILNFAILQDSHLTWAYYIIQVHSVVSQNTTWNIVKLK